MLVILILEKLLFVYDSYRKSKDVSFTCNLISVYVICGLPQAGILSRIHCFHAYYELPHTHGLQHHIFHPIPFKLAMNDFEVKYVGLHTLLITLM